MSDNGTETLIGVAVAVGFPLFWVLIMTVIGRFGGWGTLAEFYRAQDDFEGQRWRFESARFERRANYGSCLMFGANARGLHLSILFLMRPGHPPLFIPWDEVAMQRRKRWMFPYVDLRFRRAPGIGLLLRARLGEQLAAASGRPLLAEEKA